MPIPRLADSGPQDLTLAHNRKVLRVARDFEAQLLSSVLGSLEKTFTEIGTPDNDPGSQNYQALSMQALGKALADKGGVGIARLIAPHLMKPEKSSAQNGHQASS